MGLLDEAIRDHLELKRRRGADPGEIARVQREALEPVFPGPPDPAELAVGAAGQRVAVYVEDPEAYGDEPDSAEVGYEPADRVEGEHEADARHVHTPDPASLMQETAELDMQAVLDADGALSGAEHPHAPPAPDPQAGRLPPTTTDVPQPLPGQERMSFE
jgi:hypothetical protein